LINDVVDLNVKKNLSLLAFVVFWYLILRLISGHINEKVAVVLFLYGGFISAFCFLTFASFFRASNLVRCALLFLTFLALCFQGGCFMVLGGIGTATGGSDTGADKMMIPVGLGFLVAFVWGLLLLIFLPAKEVETLPKRFERKQNPPNESDDKK
jgi:hypothetical protein